MLWPWHSNGVVPPAASRNVVSPTFRPKRPSGIDVALGNTLPPPPTATGEPPCGVTVAGPPKLNIWHEPPAAPVTVESVERSRRTGMTGRTASDVPRRRGLGSPGVAFGRHR